MHTAGSSPESPPSDNEEEEEAEAEEPAAAEGKKAVAKPVAVSAAEFSVRAHLGHREPTAPPDCLSVSKPPLTTLGGCLVASMQMAEPTKMAVSATSGRIRKAPVKFSESRFRG